MDIISMSLISNRKRPRGFSETFDANQDKTCVNKSKTNNGYFDNNSSSSGSTYNEMSPSSSNNLNLNMNINLNKSDTTINTNESNTKKVNFGMNENFNKDSVVIEDLDSDDDENDDVIILEERQIGANSRSRRNNSDSVLTFNDAFAAYNMLNVNNSSEFEINQYSFPLSSTLKKQRTNSLPQLPQAKCFYNKPDNYVLQYPKLGNVRTDVIPHQLNLPPCDDNDGHYIIKTNDMFANRFIILKLLGQGTFGKVVECFDKVNRETVAIKIIRNIPKYRDAAKIELRILSTLKKFDNQNDNHCIHLRECFDYRGHICIVTDLLQISLYDFLERNKYISFPGSHIQAISKQLIRSVTFLHDLSLIHTDLKPENILLHDDSFTKKHLKSCTIISSYTSLTKMNESSKKIPKFSKILKNPLIQIIDFGSAIFNDEYHSSIVSTRHYRAPEIVLGVGWSFPCDMWSIACILVELVIGEPLFKTHDNLEHLAMIERVCGYKIDKSMVLLSKAKENECGLQYFSDEYRESSDDDNDDDDVVIIDDELTQENSLSLCFPTEATPQKFITSVNQLARIDVFISSRIGLDINFDYSLSNNFDRNKHVINFGNFTFWWFFIDLLKNLLIVNPNDRLTALEALEHPWFNLGIEDEGTMN